MRILIIGGTRFIGLQVVRQLLNKNHEVIVLHRGHSPAPEGVREMRAERNQLPYLSAEFQRLAPDVVLDMIPFIEKDARTVMNIFPGMAGRVVMISSMDVYRAFGRVNKFEPGPPDPLPLTEDSPLRGKFYPYRGPTPRSEDDPMYWADEYDKIPLEKLFCSNPQLPCTVLRLPAVYGPNDKQHRLFEYARRMADQRPAIVLEAPMAHWRWTRGYVENVAAAIVTAIENERAAGRIYNVGEPTALSNHELIQALARVMNWRGRIVTLPTSQLPDALCTTDMDLDQDIIADTSRIRTELNYTEIIPFDEGLKRTVEWELANPPEQYELHYPAEDEIIARLNPS